MNILLDGMGGDNAPLEIVKGAIKAAPEIDGQISIIGKEQDIQEAFSKLGYTKGDIKVINATEVVTNNEAPAMAVRKKRDSSITRGMGMVKSGEADAFLSAGSTGALLSAGLFFLGRIKGIQRPAIAAFFPKIGKNDTTLLLDCGANVESKPEYLLQNGIMGSIFVEKVKGVDDPEVKLLNVGAEDEKGDSLHKEAFQMLSGADINFQGNCEGRDVPFGCCDVCVTDGFSGNVLLKSSEGVAMAIMGRIKEKLKESPVSMMGAALAGGKLRDLKKEFDYSEEGGAPILGLKGPVLKMHGSSNADAVYNAILKAVPYVEKDVTGTIERAVAEYSAREEEREAEKEETEAAEE